MSVLKVTKTDTLKVEYMPLAITDLSVPFIWRTTEPLLGPWIVGRFTVIQTFNKSFEELIGQMALDDWKERQKWLADYETPVVPEIQWLLDINKVKVVKVTTVPQEDINTLNKKREIPNDADA
jgi:hypothetical protein